ncbi:MAG: alpha-mannosidase [Clostridia bacterium]|nr:alpha-mannosidase [Clostridia bacterium]
MSKLYLIGNAHLDPVWLWRWQEGFSEILATYRSALDRMKEFPDFKFTSACAMYYEWIEKTDPQMFEEIKERVKEGRWNIVGGMLIQPDCNIPCGESFARHFLLGQRYFKEKFGITVNTGYNVDSFGHNASMPKILNGAGIKNYVFMRPSVEEKPELPQSVFNWESSDGSSVSTFRIHDRYCITSDNLELFDRIKALSDRDNLNHMAFYGVGNHGGGPTIRLLHEIHNLDIEGLVFSTPDEYFDSLDKNAIPTICDELQHHARGCYSAETSVKASNRKCEQNLLAAEKFCTMASKLTNYKYPRAKLQKAWKSLLFNHFHDIMCGCAIKSAYRDAGYLYGEIMSITEQEINKALTAISLNIDTLKDETLPCYKTPDIWTIWGHEKLGTPIVVFNPHSWEVTAPVELYIKAVKVTDSQGRENPLQYVRGEMLNHGKDHMTTFNAKVPAYGYEVYRIFTKEMSETEFVKTTSASEYCLENSKIKVVFSPETGDICKFFDKENNRSVIDKPCSAVLLDETAFDTWAHGTDNLGPVSGVFRGIRFEVISDGNVKSTLRVTSEYKNSVIRRDYTITPDSKVVTVKTVTNIGEKNKCLKLRFPTNGGNIISQIPYGTFERRQNTGEQPSGTWLACGNLCIANDSKYGYDTEAGYIRLSVLRTAAYADHFSQGLRDVFTEYMDMDSREFTYSIFPFDSIADAEKKASELNFGLRFLNTHFHKGTLPEKDSFIEVEGDNVIVTAIKKSEDSDGSVIRFFDIEGEDSVASVKLFGKEISAELGHDAVKTILVDKDEIRELNLCEM